MMFKLLPYPFHKKFHCSFPIIFATQKNGKPILLFLGSVNPQVQPPPPPQRVQPHPMVLAKVGGHSLFL